VGGQVPIRVDVRVIAATHHDLAHRVTEGDFREDLYHRLNVMHIETPPLRARSEDVPLLLGHYLRVAAGELGVPVKLLAADAEQALTQFKWPGNVRQLVNACRRLTVVAPGREIQHGDIPLELGGGTTADPDGEWDQMLRSWAEQRLASGTVALLEDALPRFERTLIETALARSQGHRQEAARLLGWGRNTLTRKIRELGIKA